MIPRAIRIEAVGSLTGLAIGDATTAPRCTTCGAYLFTDTEVFGYAYRFTDEQELSLARLYCDECEQNPLAYPTLGAHELVVEATLRQRQGMLLLDDPVVVEYVDPSAGSEC